MTTVNRGLRIAVVSGVLALSSCASVQQDARFPQVQNTVSERLGTVEGRV